MQPCVAHTQRVQHWTLIGDLGGSLQHTIVDENLIENCDQAGGVVAYGVNITGDQSGRQSFSISILFRLNIVRNVPSWDAIGSHDAMGFASSAMIAGTSATVST